MLLSEVIDTLHQLFPEGYYSPSDLYQDLRKAKGWSSNVLQKYRDGLSTIAWMRSIGLEPLELPMRPRSVEFSASEQIPDILIPLLSDAFSSSLLGNVIPSNEQRDSLYSHARAILMRVIDGKRVPLSIESDIIVLEIVLLLQNWNEPSEDVESETAMDTGFWEYICEQYAVPYDNATYKLFQGMIKCSLQRHRCLIASTGKKYYTTLLTHALAPASKFEVLFEQVYYFYSRDLNYQYIEDDSAFHKFSISMKKRFLGQWKKSDGDIYIKSLQSSSAIQLLFQECPYYMGAFVKMTVEKIDQLVSTGRCSDNTLSPPTINNGIPSKKNENKTGRKKQ